MSTLLEKANSILAEKTTKILPENLKKNITAFGVTGTLETGAKLNIYTQLTEPTKKDGLWLKTSNTPTSIVDDENVYTGGEWNLDKMSELKAIPYSFYSGSATSIGTDIYIFGGSGGDTRAYKYDTTTDTYTQLTNIPYSFREGSTASVGTDIYLFGSASGSFQTAYKYNTLTDTYTQLTIVPYSFYYGGAASVGTDIYLFGSKASGSYETAYKYNTLTDTYTQLANIPYSFYYGGTASVGTDIYLFGGGSSNTTAYKYDTTTDTYTQLTNIPYKFHRGSAVSVNGDIYLFGGSNDTANTKVQLLSVLPKEYADNSIVIANNSKINRYKTKLIDTEVTNGLKYDFNDFWYATTENNTTTFDTTIEKYVGDGTTWTKIN